MFVVNVLCSFYQHFHIDLLCMSHLWFSLYAYHVACYLDVHYWVISITSIAHNNYAKIVHKSFYSTTTWMLLLIDYRSLFLCYRSVYTLYICMLRLSWMIYWYLGWFLKCCYLFYWKCYMPSNLFFFSFFKYVDMVRAQRSIKTNMINI